MDEVPTEGVLALTLGGAQARRVPFPMNMNCFSVRVLSLELPYGGVDEIQTSLLQ